MSQAPQIDVRPPPTRYQGSKRRLLPWLREILAPLQFRSALDLFSGTASVGYLLKSLGKQVTCNDYLHSNYWTALALVANDDQACDEPLIGELTTRRRGGYDDFIERTYQGIYFTDEENRWLDVAAQNLASIRGPVRQAVAAHVLFQACLAKRPYNLFHRANLYMRLADVQRSFGNKKTWDAAFESHMQRAAAALSDSLIASERPCRAICGDALQAPRGADFVYADPPYIGRRSAAADYFEFYHFLEGIADYDRWPQRLDLSRKHRPLQRPSRSPFSDPRRVTEAMEQLIDRFGDSILVISYRSDGIPSIEELRQTLLHRKRRVTVHDYGQYTYALSTNRKSREVVLVGQ